MRKHRKTGKRGSLRNVKGSPGKVLPGAALTIRSLEVFVIVARAGTMVAAAERLKLSQPAISQMIRSLEQSLGVQLFDRAVRPPVLTLQGTALLQHAKAITESVDQFRSTVRLGGAAQLPLLRIGVLNSFATTVGPYVFKQLRNVAAEWAIDSGFQATRYRAVAERNFDFAITADEAPIPDGIEVTPLLSEPFLLIVPASYKRERVSLQNLSKDLDLIRFGRDPALHIRLDRELARRGLIAQHRYHLDTTEGVLSMVAVGSGWTILSPLAVIKALARGDAIRALPFPGKPFQRTINIVSLKNQGQEIVAQIRDASIDVLTNQFIPQAKRFLPQHAHAITIHRGRRLRFRSPNNLP
jgi:DNA-binding transcriptional LysR family regulator